jgi:hypothetical protein
MRQGGTRENERRRQGAGERKGVQATLLLVVEDRWRMVVT